MKSAGESMVEADADLACATSRSNFAAQFDTACAAMTTGLIERDLPARLLIMAALASEHVLLVGPPGTAKSELARRLRSTVVGGRYFERLLTKFSVPEEIFGPLSIRSLERDEYRRLTDGYLPSASVAFLDEIFNANSAILNALLTLLNEREFDNGTVRETTALATVVAASNTVAQGPELAALQDRFLFRFHVQPVSSAAFARLLEPLPRAPPKEAPSLSSAVIDAVRDAGGSTSLGAAARHVLTSVRRELAAGDLYVSDRRWQKIAKVVRLAAAIEGRREASLSDCAIIVHCLWNSVEQKELVQRTVEAAIGCVLVEEPRRLAAVVTALQREIERDLERREHKLNDEGRPLFEDESGQVVADPYESEHAKNERGDLLFHPPPSLAGSNPKVAYTLAELWEASFRERPNGMAALKAWVGNPANRHLRSRELRKRVDEPSKFSSEHVDARMTQVKDALADVQSYRSALADLTVERGSIWSETTAELDVTRTAATSSRAGLEQTEALLIALVQVVEGMRARVR